MRIGDRASWGAWSSYRSGVSALRAGAESVQAHEIAAVTSQVENAKDMARTRDGWTGSIQSMMGRMGELAVTANDGTLFAMDAAHVQVEFDQMQQAIQEVTSGPNAMGQFNGHFLFQA